MSTTTIPSFPKTRLAAARHALEIAYNRLVRAAARAGQTAPSAPELVVVREVWVSRCTECKCVFEGVAGGTCIACKEGVLIARECLDLEVRCDRPALAGWEFLAVVEPLVGGNLIRQVPGANVADGELESWRTGDIACDHCRAARQRKETFIVRADGSDSAIAAGTYKQVGRNCLEAFLGGRSPAAIIAALGWADLVRLAGDDGEGGGWGGGDPAWEAAEFMAWVASSARLLGYVSAKQARDSVNPMQSTAAHACYLQTPPFGGEARERWTRARDEFRPTDADRVRGLAALTWARELSPGNDYERNLHLIATQPALERKHAGILASAISAHARFIGEQLKRAQRGESTHVGAVGAKLEIEIVIERVVSIESNYGPMHIVTMRDTTGNAFVWRTGTEAPAVTADLVTIKGTVKRHTEYKGEKQTELTRCRFVARKFAKESAPVFGPDRRFVEF